MKQPSYFTCNVPLQAWARHEDDDNEESPVVDHRILNYMPARNGAKISR